MTTVSPPSEHVLVLCTYPDQPTARVVANDLVQRGLAACVNMSESFRSIYAWKGELREDSEVQLTIKTRLDRIEDVASRLRADHPYELPEILYTPVGGATDFLNWIDQCTQLA